jgi:hypothetical protein
LSQARSNLAATSVDNRYALFGGGLSRSGVSIAVDIFDSLEEGAAIGIEFFNETVINKLLVK